MISSFLLSIILHSMLILGMLVGTFFHSKKRGIELPNDTAIIVNFTKIGPESKAPIIGPPASGPEIAPEKKAVKKEPPKKEISRKKEEKSLPNKGDIAAKKKKQNKKESKAIVQEETKRAAQPQRTGPLKLGMEGAQRADSFGLEVVASEASLIKEKLDRYWSPPEVTENSGVKVRMYLDIDYETGRIKGYHVIERDGPPHLYSIFESRIAFVLNNPEIDFLELSDETRKLLSERGLEVVFDADTMG